MKFSVNREELVERLAAVAVTIPRKSSFPIVSNVLLEAQAGLVTLTGTDLSARFVATLETDVDVVGEITVEAGLFRDVLDRFEAEVIECEWVEDRLAIRSLDDGEVMLQTMAATEYPQKGWAGTDQSFSVLLPRAWFTPIWKSVANHVASDDNRPVLRAVNLETHGEIVILAATDGYRLGHWRGVTPQTWGEGDYTANLPAVAISDFLGHAPGDDVELTFNCELMKLTSGWLTAVVNLVDGNYPDYRPIIPTSHAGEYVINKKLLVQASKLAEVIARSATNKPVVLMYADGVLEVRSATDAGKNAAICRDVRVKGQVETVAVNVAYLLSSLNAAQGELVAVQVTTPTSPIVVTDFREDGAEWKSIIMPIHTPPRLVD